MLIIKLNGNVVETYWNDVFTNSGDNLCEELNSWLNNGYKLVKVENDSYFLEEDETQLMAVMWLRKDGNDTIDYYYQIMTHAKAFCIRQYYDGVLYDDEENEINIDEKDIKMIDLRGCSDEYVKSLKNRKVFTDDFDLLEAVLEDLSYV